MPPNLTKLVELKIMMIIVFMSKDSETWDIIAKGYAEKRGFGKGSIDHEKNMIVDFLSDRKPNLVIDVGCGTGRHVRSMKSMGINVIGTDFSREMLKEARKLGKDDYLISDAHELPFVTDSIDCCICMGNSIGSFSKPEKAMLEMIRVSKSLLIEFRHESDKSGILKRRFDMCEYNIRVWSLEEVSEMLNEFYESEIISSFKIVIGQKLQRGYFFYAVIDK